jgi:hypothetical protein
MWYWAIAVATMVVVCLALNAMRYAADGAYGTSAHVNLSMWDHFLLDVNPEDVRVAGLTGFPLPLRVSVEQLRDLGHARKRRSGSDLSLPSVEDPWGHPVIVEFLAEAPQLRWRVRSHVGRSFVGAWIDKTITLP